MCQFLLVVDVDCTQVQSHLPVTQLQLAAASQQQEQHPVHHTHLPAVLKSSDTPVDMSLVLKAARDVPLQLLSAEYEKVGVSKKQYGAWGGIGIDKESRHRGRQRAAAVVCGWVYPVLAAARHPQHCTAVLQYSTPLPSPIFRSRLAVAQLQSWQSKVWHFQ